MVSLRSGKKVPFLGKNIPKRAYKYKTPIPKEDENELVSKLGSISIHEPNDLPEPTESTKSENDAQDTDVNEVTYGSMPSLEGSALEDTSIHAADAESNLQNENGVETESENKSDIEIKASELPSNILDIVNRFETEMIKFDEQFELMGLLKASAKVAGTSSGSFLDSSVSSQNSVSSDSSHDMTSDSFLISDESTINGNITKRKQTAFSDISSASSLSSTLQTMADKAIGSDTSADCTETSESNYAEICEMYNEFCQ